MRNLTATVYRDGAGSQTTSDWVRVGAEVSCRGLVAIVTPATVTSTTLTVQVSLNGTDALSHYDYTGVSYVIPILASRWISLDPALFAGFPYVRIVTGSNEAAERTFTLMTTEVA